MQNNEKLPKTNLPEQRDGADVTRRDGILCCVNQFRVHHAGHETGHEARLERFEVAAGGTGLQLVQKMQKHSAADVERRCILGCQGRPHLWALSIPIVTNSPQEKLHLKQHSKHACF